jgi:hypothetical protein
VLDASFPIDQCLIDCVKSLLISIVLLLSHPQPSLNLIAQFLDGHPFYTFVFGLLHLGKDLGFLFL